MSAIGYFDEYLTPVEAAQRLKRSVRTLARMRAEGRGPDYHKEGAKVLYPTSAIYEWAARFLKSPPRNAT